MSDLVFTDQEAEIQIVKLETVLAKSPENVEILGQLGNLYSQVGKKKKATKCVEDCLALLHSKNDINGLQGFEVVKSAVKFWSSAKYTQKDTALLNWSPERKSLLAEIRDALDIVSSKRDESLANKVAVQRAYVKESMGKVQDSLAILSDLITAQPPDIDLTFVIFKAAMVLKYIGGNETQVIEYLEFLLDDPPEGYSKTHILACLACVYEQGGDHFSVLLEKTYEELQETYIKDLTSGKTPVTNRRKLDTMMAKKPLSQGSEIWEILGLQAVDRCEYVLAVELIGQGARKAPNKSKLQHLLAELYYLLDNTKMCIRCAERAFALQDQTPELRNLLLAVDPDRWRDKLRTVAPTQDVVEERAMPSSRAASRPGSREKTRELGSDKHWLSKANDKFMASAASLLGVGDVKSMEEKAKEAAEKENKRRLKRQKKEQKEKRLQTLPEGQSQQLIDKAGPSEQPVRPRKRDPAIDGPAKPEKPVVTQDVVDLVRSIQHGKSVPHFYDETLRAYAAIRLAVQQEEKELRERKRAANEKRNQDKKSNRKR